MTSVCLFSPVRIVLKFKHKSRKSLSVTPACFVEDSRSAAPTLLQWGPHLLGAIPCDSETGTGHDQ